MTLGEEEENSLLNETPKIIEDDVIPGSSFWSPRNAAYKFIMLGVITTIMIGSTFSYDEISPLKDDMTSMGFCTSTQYARFYSWYSIPNTVLVFFGGIFGDVLGFRTAGMILISIVLIGVSFVTVGGNFAASPSLEVPGYWIMLAGRVVFGIGNESLSVIQGSMTMLWFRNTKHLSFAFGLMLTVNRVADFAAISLGAPIAQLLGEWYYVLFVGLGLVVCSWFGTVLYCLFDYRAELVLPSRQQLRVKMLESRDSCWSQVVALIASLKATLKFESRLWLIATIIAFYYSAIFPFNANSPQFLQKNYGYSTTTAGYISSIVTFVPIFFAAIAGKFFDFVGYRPFFICLGCIMTTFSHSMLLAATFWPNSWVFNPIFPMIVIAFSYAFVPGALWPSIPLLVGAGDVATAVGVTTAIQNTMLAIQNQVVGYVTTANTNTFPKDESHTAYSTIDFSWTIFLFVVVDVIALIASIGLILVDRFKGASLCKPAQEVKAVQLEVNIEETTDAISTKIIDSGL